MVLLLKINNMTTEVKVAKQISKLAGFDILKKTRKREYIEARSLLFYVLSKYYEQRNCSIKRHIKVGGKPLNHATILHSVKSFEIYRRYNKNLDKWLDAITIDEDDQSPRELKINYIKSKLDYLLPEDIDQLANQVRDMFEEAIIE
jgi:hypothetical protein